MRVNKWTVALSIIIILVLIGAICYSTIPGVPDPAKAALSNRGDGDTDSPPSGDQSAQVLENTETGQAGQAAAQEQGSNKDENTSPNQNNPAVKTGDTSGNRQQTVQGQSENSAGAVVLTIKGVGVGHETTYTLSQLKSYPEAQADVVYSAVNNWPTAKFFVGKGIKIADLLKLAGIKAEAAEVIFKAKDGYKTTLTLEQLLDKRYCYPNLLEKSMNGKQEVPAILAWEHKEDCNDLKKAIKGDLRLLIGQIGINDPVTPVCAKMVCEIEILTDPAGQWADITAQPAPGKIAKGTGIVLGHPDQDRVKIYYTTDGSDPTVQSPVYNPSTTYFQPDLIKPVTVNQNTTIKAMAIGFGKNNSKVAVFTYEVAD